MSVVGRQAQAPRWCLMLQLTLNLARVLSSNHGAPCYDILSHSISPLLMVVEMASSARPHYFSPQRSHLSVRVQQAIHSSISLDWTDPKQRSSASIDATNSPMRYYAIPRSLFNAALLVRLDAPELFRANAYAYHAVVVCSVSPHKLQHGQRVERAFRQVHQTTGKV